MSWDEAQSLPAKLIYLNNLVATCKEYTLPYFTCFSCFVCLLTGDSIIYYEVGTSPKSQTISRNSFYLVSQGYHRSLDTDLFQSMCKLTIVSGDGARVASYKVSVQVHTHKY